MPRSLFEFALLTRYVVFDVAVTRATYSANTWNSLTISSSSHKKLSLNYDLS